MKRSFIALSLLAVLSLAACANGTGWTPECGDRTAGKCMKAASGSGKANKAFNQSLHK